LKKIILLGLGVLRTAPFVFSLVLASLMFGVVVSCKKDAPVTQPPVARNFELLNIKLNNKQMSTVVPNLAVNPTFELTFSAVLDTNSAKKELAIKEGGFTPVPVVYNFSHSDSTVSIRCEKPLKYFTKYTLTVPTTLASKLGGRISKYYAAQLRTGMDTSIKFSVISDNQLMDSVQYRNLQYFWNFAHPISGLARERNTSGDLVTSGGSGMGVMAIITGVNRNFISRSEAVDHLTIMSHFLLYKTKVYHGAFPHWLNGANGNTIAFSTNDDGADLVETSYLIQGLLTARQYFNNAGSKETSLRNKIDSIWHRVEWKWFTKNGAETNLYWHWSPNKGFIMNMPIRGWNECLITHVLAASSPTYPVSTDVYKNCWASNGGMKNGKSFYGYKLPLGPDYGGPMFFAHYSFLGIDPRGLTDQYADYWQQNQNHALINYTYCKQNPKNFGGYSAECWGLTASDDPWGYDAHSPTNDRGVISPTAALASMPFTPNESKAAMRFFYYKLGDRIWGEYGFVDAFNINETWVADSYLAIDQGPIVVMIENYRSSLLWEQFTSCNEVKAGMKKLGFSAPYL
jgi:hypothetical protein